MWIDINLGNTCISASNGATTEPGTIRATSTSRSDLNAYLQQIVGQPLLDIRFTYGEELTLHFGVAQPDALPWQSKAVWGSYLVTTRGSAWVLSTPSPHARVFASNPLSGAATPCGRSAETSLMEAESVRLRGALIVRAEATSIEQPPPPPSAVGFVLRLHLSEGSSFVVLPAVDDEDDGEDLGEPVADWEVVTPHGKFLRVGPGLQWAYLDSATEADTASPAEPGVPAPA